MSTPTVSAPVAAAPNKATVGPYAAEIDTWRADRESNAAAIARAKQRAAATGPELTADDETVDHLDALADTDPTQLRDVARSLLRALTQSRRQVTEIRRLATDFDPAGGALTAAQFVAAVRATLGMPQ